MTKQMMEDYAIPDWNHNGKRFNPTFTRTASGKIGFPKNNNLIHAFFVKHQNPDKISGRK